MSVPVVERIAVALFDMINEITTDNHFNQNLIAVRPKRLHLEGDINTDNTVIIEQENATFVSQTAETITWRQQFTLQALVLDSDKATDPIDTRLNTARADIEKQLGLKINYTCGGLAEGILFRDPEKFISDPEVAGIAINIDVIYTTAYGDPYVAMN